MPRRIPGPDPRDDDDAPPPVRVPELPASLARLTDTEGRKKQDPKDINLRLYRQMDMLLLQLEDPDQHITAKERAAAIAIIARIQAIFIMLRKEGKAEDDSRAGSSVRKYAEAFSNDAGRRKKRARVRIDPSEDQELTFTREFDSGDEDDLLGH